jgi:GNAT superfamily N-acetyltransferase
MAIQIRPYTLHDFDQLLDLQREAFPPPFPEELLWRRDQIASHVQTFSAGALAALLDDNIVGSATCLIIQYDGLPHTWEEVADQGYIRASHDPNGDSLYGIDLCVRPSYRGHGIAQALYDARKEIVKNLQLKRFIAGARIPGYHNFANHLSAEEYVAKVTKGELKDLVLSFMLKQGLQPLQVLSEYLDDEESLNHGVVVEWRNPKSN